jgi:SAM-dependent methyltransferase
MGDRVVEFMPDVGAVTAHLVRKERVVCLEPDPAKARFLRRRFGHRPNVRVVEGAIEDEKSVDELRAERPDTVLCVNSLAAAEDDSALLERFARILDGKGRLVLLVPAGQWLFSPLDRAQGRLRRYSRRGLGRKLEEAGFEIERLRSFDRAGTLAWLVWGKLLRRRRAPRTALGLFDLLTPLWRVLDYVIPLPALSLVAVAPVCLPVRAVARTQTGRRTGRRPPGGLEARLD